MAEMKCVNCMNNSHIFALKTFFLFFVILVLTFQIASGNINKLSLMRQTKFEKFRVEMSTLSCDRRQKIIRKKMKKVVDKAKKI